LAHFPAKNPDFGPIMEDLEREEIHDLGFGVYKARRLKNKMQPLNFCENIFFRSRRARALFVLLTNFQHPPSQSPFDYGIFAARKSFLGNSGQKEAYF
jgi:hypothetical protein